MNTVLGVSYSAIPYNAVATNPTTGKPVGGCRYADVSGFPPCRLYFPGAPASGVVQAIYSTGTADCRGTLYAADGTPLAVIAGSNKGLAVSYSGGAPTFVAQTGSSVFLTFSE